MLLEAYDTINDFVVNIHQTVYDNPLAKRHLKGKYKCIYCGSSVHVISPYEYRNKKGHLRYVEPHFKCINSQCSSKKKYLINTF